MRLEYQNQQTGELVRFDLHIDQDAVVKRLFHRMTNSKNGKATSLGGSILMRLVDRRPGTVSSPEQP